MALVTTIRIINISLSWPLELQIPYELWIGKKPSYDKLSIFLLQGLFSHVKRCSPKVRAKVREMCFPQLWTRRQLQQPTLGPQKDADCPKFGHSFQQVGYA